MKTTHSDTIALLSNQRNYRAAADYALKEVTDLDERVDLLTKILVEVREHGSVEDAIYISDHLEEQSEDLADEERTREWDDVPTVRIRPMPVDAS